MSLFPFTSSHFISLNIVDLRLLERFERAGIRHLTDLAVYTPLEISLKFRLPLARAQSVLEGLFSILAIQPTTAYDMLLRTSASYLPTKLPTLNRHLNGGLRRGSLVELCGSWGRNQQSAAEYVSLHLSLLQEQVVVKLSSAFI